MNAALAVSIDDPRWCRRVRGAHALVRRAARAALDGAARVGEIRYKLADDSCLRALNHDFRGLDKPTNVLSFPDDAPGALGDVALAFETCAAEARAQGKKLDAHLAHLVVHGTLHLLGWDHETIPEALAMEARERRVLRRLRVPDPYRARKFRR
ncbi:MAG: rRNA maturation RNase YbeY [Tagaea sp.]|nr:rRNA maturation RNase YbeY [Tagaea sp.]